VTALSFEQPFVFTWESRYVRQPVECALIGAAC
jgi:hypothetical protein